MFLDCSSAVLAVPVKVCKKCGEAKLHDEFHKAKGGKDGLNPRCKQCRCAEEEERRRKQGIMPRDVADPDAETRRCTKCGETKPLTREYFTVRSNGRLGTRCLACQSEYDKVYWHANREKRIQQKKQHYDANREEMREKSRQWSRANPDKVKATNKAWYEANKDRAADNNRKWVSKNREKKNDISYRWKRANRLISQAATQRHIARKRNLPNTFTGEDWQSALDYFGGCCAVCGRSAGLWHHLAMDHWIPIASSDCPGTVPWNIVPLCGGAGGCNNSKSHRNAADWLIEKFGPRKGRAILRKIEAFLESRKQDAA